MGPDPPPTCGEGLVEHAAVPARMADLLDALADNLDAHVPTIDTREAAGRRERDAYLRLISEYRGVAERLAAAAGEMRACRDLPPADHHEEKLFDPFLLELFERLVAVERELVDLLRASADRDEAMLRAARGVEG